MVTQSAEYYSETPESMPREWYQRDAGDQRTGVLSGTAGLLLGGLAVGASSRRSCIFRPTLSAT